jgi:hypothetical protein
MRTYRFALPLAFISAVAFTCKIVVLDHTAAIEQAKSNSYFPMLIARCSALLGGHGLVGALMLALLAFVYIKFLQKPIWCPYSFVCALMFGGFTLLGHSYHYHGNWGFLFAGIQQFMLSTVILVGYVLLFYCLICLLFHSLENSEPPRKAKKVPFVFEKWLDNTMFLKLMLLLILCWSPYILSHYPGSVPYDGYLQLRMFYNDHPISNHHPVVSTWMLGFLFQAGRSIGGDNIGVLVTVVAQTLLTAAVTSLMIIEIFNITPNRVIRYLSLAYFALFSAWPANVQAISKDVFYAAFFGLFYLTLMRYLSQPQQFKRPLDYILLFLFGSCVCLFRSNGIYILIPVAVVVAIYVLKKHLCLKILLPLFAAVVPLLVINNLVIPAMEIGQGGVVEALSIPIQQTARYLNEHGAEVTDQEKETINNVFDYDNMAKMYNPVISDPVKNLYKYGSTSSELMEYMHVWFQMFLKHPATYVQAFFHHTYGYYYTENPVYAHGGLYDFYITDTIIVTDYFSFAYPESSASIRSLMSDIARMASDIPGVGLLVTPAIYTWIALLCLFYSLRRKQYRKIFYLLPAFLTIFICLLSPVNGYMRYALPTMIISPLMLCLCFCQNNVEVKKKNG